MAGAPFSSVGAAGVPGDPSRHERGGTGVPSVYGGVYGVYTG